MSTDHDRYELVAIGRIESTLTNLREAPRQGNEGAPEAWISVDERYAEALDGLEAGQEILLITWLHRSDRAVMKTRPRNNHAAPLTGIFATRSPDRPNPLGLHRVTILDMDGLRLRVGPLEAIDGTPVVDIKPVIARGDG
jgi:tRNA-Thr(GGU) m(6)t(6)A37 methyltransferase TsaA